MKSFFELLPFQQNPLEQKSSEIKSEIIKTVRCLCRSFYNKDFERTKILIQKLDHLIDIARTIQGLLSSNRKGLSQSKKPIFIVGTKFLHDCYKYLTSMGTNEVFHYITGIHIGDVRILDNMQKVALKRQSPCGAETDMQSSAKAFITMDQFGHHLLATAHSHPAGYTKESQTDLQDMQEFFNGGHKILGLVFTMDGYVRFYSRMPFNLIIYGDGLEEIHENLYKFTHSA